MPGEPAQWAHLVKAPGALGLLAWEVKLQKRLKEIPKVCPSGRKTLVALTSSGKDVST